MAGFEIEEHTADVAVVATGADLGEALAWLAKGMFSIIAELEHVRPRETVEFSVSAHDPESLAVDWLNELLYRFEVDGFLPRDFRVAPNQDRTSLRARCVGERLDPSRHSILLGVKAATYHELQVSHNGEWRIRVVLDV